MGRKKATQLKFDNFLPPSDEDLKEVEESLFPEEYCTLPDDIMDAYEEDKINDNY